MSCNIVSTVLLGLLLGRTQMMCRDEALSVGKPSDAWGNLMLWWDWSHPCWRRWGEHCRILVSWHVPATSEPYIGHTPSPCAFPTQECHNHVQLSPLRSGPAFSFSTADTIYFHFLLKRSVTLLAPVNQILRHLLTACGTTTQLTLSDLDSLTPFKEYAFQIISYKLDTGQILTHFHSECSYILTVKHIAFWL